MKSLFSARVGAAVLSFVGVWGVAVWYTHVSLSSLPHPSDGLVPDDGTPQDNQIAGLAHAQDPKNVYENEHNPYFGWQPPIADQMACSWRTCLQKNHSCTTCRDLESEMGPAPTVPDDWVPDVTVLKRMRLAGRDATGKPWPPPLDDELCEPMGGNGGRNDINKNCKYIKLRKRVHAWLAVSNHSPVISSKMWTVLDQVPIVAQSPNDQDNNQQKKHPKIMCMLYTMETAHATTIRAIRETWASHCDGFLAFSTASDPRIPAISLPHDGPEEYGNMWQKVRSIWKFVGTHYIDDFDWFFQGGDDLFVLPQNLRNYLGTLDPNEDYFVGRRFKGYGKDNYFNSGGSGYALSRSILRKYVTEGFEDPHCAPDRQTSMEDVMMAQCLRRRFGVGLTDTRDDHERERFHPFAPGTHLTWRPPGPGGKDWYEDYNKEWPVKLGVDCCAPDSVSFHYIKKPAMVRHIHALLYHCGKK